MKRENWNCKKSAKVFIMPTDRRPIRRPHVPRSRWAPGRSRRSSG